jgi:hypothetical protein
MEATVGRNLLMRKVKSIMQRNGKTLTFGTCSVVMLGGLTRSMTGCAAVDGGGSGKKLFSR